MTAQLLLTCLGAALLLQVAAGMGVIVWRRRALAARTAQLAEPRPQAPSAGAWSGWRDFRVTSRNLEDAAKSQCSFQLQPVDGLPLPAFKPGQYLTFSLQVGGRAGAFADAECSLTRCYSLSDRPDPSHYRITIKRMAPPPGRPDLLPGASSNHFHDRVQQGDVLKVKAPSGHF